VPCGDGLERARSIRKGQSAQQSQQSFPLFETHAHPMPTAQTACHGYRQLTTDDGPLTKDNFDN